MDDVTSEGGKLPSGPLRSWSVLHDASSDRCLAKKSNVGLLGFVRVRQMSCKYVFQLEFVNIFPNKFSLWKTLALLSVTIVTMRLINCCI